MADWDPARLRGPAYHGRIAYSSAVADDLMPVVATAIAGLALAVGTLLIRSSGANTRAGRRLAGARHVSLPDLHAAAIRGELSAEAVRVEGRVRCADPILTPDGEKLAVRHRDVEVQQADGRWRVIERLRETRAIDLWQRSTSVSVDLDQLAEPLITIPHVWEGSPDELDATHQPAVARLTADEQPPIRARATTRQVMLVDELIILAIPLPGDDGMLRLAAPPGGFLVATVELDVALRLLAGPHRRRMIAGYAVAAGGAVTLVVAGVLLLVSALA